MTPDPVTTIAVPAAPTAVGPALERLMDQFRVDAAYPVQPSRRIRLPHQCDHCGRAEWDQGRLSFRCPGYPKGATLGTAAPCRYWAVPHGCVVLDLDSGAVYLFR